MQRCFPSDCGVRFVMCVDSARVVSTGGGRRRCAATPPARPGGLQAAISRACPYDATGLRRR